MASKRSNVSLPHYYHLYSLCKSFNSIQVVNDSKDTNGSVSGHSRKTEDDENDRDGSDDDKEDEGGPGDTAVTGGKLELAF